MRNTKLLAIGAFMAVIGGGQALLADEPSFRDARQVQNEKFDLRADRAKVESLRAEIASDKIRLSRHLRERRFGLVAEDRKELARDERALNFLLAHVANDRNNLRDDRRDLREDRFRR